MSLELFFNQFDLITTAPNGVARLREMILYLAVRGQLVEQRNVEESAHKLLEKIRTEKNAFQVKREKPNSLMMSRQLTRLTRRLRFLKIGFGRH